MLYKTERRSYHIDISVPRDEGIELNEQERIDNYSKLRREVKKIWNLSQAVVVPIVTVALGVTSKNLKDWLKRLDVKSSIEVLQKAALLRTAKIVWQILET